MADESHDLHPERSATDRAHGTHGKGDGRESLDSNPPTGTPAEEQGDVESLDEATGKLSDAAWGSAAGGGSVIDKRGPKDDADR